MEYESMIKAIYLAVILVSVVVSSADAAGIGQVKNVKGSARMERNSQQVPLRAGDALQQADVIRTGSDGSVGITFVDNSMLSVGPDTVLALDQFEFNSTTHEGAFQSSLRQGTLAVKSGKIVKQSPEAMKIHTRTAVLAVRGTEFVVSAGN